MDFLTYLFSLPQEEETDLKQIFNTSTIFDFISNNTNVTGSAKTQHNGANLNFQYRLLIAMCKLFA